MKAELLAALLAALALPAGAQPPNTPEVFGSLTQTFAHQLFLVDIGLHRSFAEEAEERLSP